jgi:hypothetical protein
MQRDVRHGPTSSRPGTLEQPEAVDLGATPENIFLILQCKKRNSAKREEKEVKGKEDEGM